MSASTSRSPSRHQGTDGFADDTVHTMSESAKTLRFRDFGWAKE
jgi:hypothetical protein